MQRYHSPHCKRCVLLNKLFKTRQHTIVAPKPFKKIMSFKELNLIEPILRALETEGYEVPTPIQRESIPAILKHRDLLGCAQTGTGKTAAFAIPIIQLLHGQHPQGPKQIQVLILTPTRELAAQIGDSFTAYGRHAGLRHTVIFGGVSQHGQEQSLKKGVDILIATPGRLLDLMNQHIVDIRHVKMFVLDEADRMLDMGFINDVKKIIARLPAKRQTLFFSATMPPDISKLAKSILTDPVYVAVTPVSSTVDAIRQSIYFVAKNDKRSLLIHLLKGSHIANALIFTRTKHGADKITRDLLKSGIKAAAIHGNKSQNARQNALNAFKSKQTRVLVATDIAARGIDIDSLSHVINYELPNVPETYVHRIGRTGRAGLSGEAISFCDGEEREYLRDIQKVIARQIPVIDSHPFPMSQSELNASTAQPAKQQQQRQHRRSSKNSNSHKGHSGQKNRRRY